MSIQEKLEDLVNKSLKKLYNLDEANFYVSLQNNEKFGDYSTNVAFSVGESENKSPNSIAEEIIAEIDKKENNLINKMEIAGGGFINFFIKKSFLIKYFLSKPIYNKSENKDKIIVEYSSINIAKPMHGGNLRATLLGDFLAKLYEYSGKKVIRWNYIGDWGTQFGKLIVAYNLWGDKNKIKNNPIDELLSLYVKFHEESEKDESLEDFAREEFKKLESGDKKNLKLLKWFTKISLKELGKTYNKLGIKFDVIKGERFFAKSSKRLVDKLLKLGVASKSEGAIIINLEDYNLSPALIEKSDGSTLYLTRDISALKYRSDKYKPEKILYVVGKEQVLHFQQLRAISEKLNLHLPNKSQISNFDHIWTGLVLGPDGKKLSTRKGKIINAKNIIEDFTNVSRKILLEKNPNIGNRELNKMTYIMGIGALRYSMLKEDRKSNIKLNPEKEFDIKGNCSFYIQYTRARLVSILKKSGVINTNIKISPDLFDDKEFELIKNMLNFETTINKCIKDSSPHHLSEFLFSLSNKINSFYESYPILKADDKTKKSRLAIIKKAEKILKDGLSIMGINSPNSI